VRAVVNSASRRSAPPCTCRLQWNAGTACPSCSHDCSPTNNGRLIISTIRPIEALSRARTADVVGRTSAQWYRPKTETGLRARYNLFRVTIRNHPKQTQFRDYSSYGRTVPPPPPLCTRARSYGFFRRLSRCRNIDPPGDFRITSRRGCPVRFRARLVSFVPRAAAILCISRYTRAPQRTRTIPFPNDRHRLLVCFLYTIRRIILHDTGAFSIPFARYVRIPRVIPR